MSEPSEDSPPRGERADDSAADSRAESRDGYDTQDLNRAYHAGRTRGRRITMAVLLPILVVVGLIAAVPCALGAYIFVICSGAR